MGIKIKIKIKKKVKCTAFHEPCVRKEPPLPGPLLHKDVEEGEMEWHRLVHGVNAIYSGNSLATVLRKWLLAGIVGFSACFVALGAETALPFVSPLFSDNMVLQRGKPNTIWGWATPGQEVSVQIGGHSAKGIAGADGRWQVRVQPPAAGGACTQLLSMERNIESCMNVLVGDVWLCGGQSNMELPLSRTRNGEEVIKSAQQPEIRFYKVAGHASYSPSAIPQGRWKICSPETVTEDGGFSAVAYYYALKLREHIHVPMGLVEDCLGGTPAEAWTSVGTLRGLKDFDSQLAELERLKAAAAPRYGNYIMPWYDEYDIGLKSKTWAAVALDDADWKTVHLPGGFRELGMAERPSVCWFRKEITLPARYPPVRRRFILASWREWTRPISTAIGSAPVRGWKIRGSMW